MLNYCTNNYTQNINFAHAHLNPKYMQILKNLIDHPNGQTRREVLLATHHTDLDTHSNGWNCGPFTLLHENGYAMFIRKGHKCLWSATPKGVQFYYANLISRDLKDMAA